jgi:hypothetical protein
MTDKRMTWEEWCEAPVPRTFINEPLDPEPETATQRARRRWGMPEEEGERDASE